MNTYSVKQIAEMLGINPETVRRWIRAGELQSVQLSRKKGNMVNETELERFINNSPRYLSRLTTVTGLDEGLPVAGIGSIVEQIISIALQGYFEENDSDCARVDPEVFRSYLRRNIDRFQLAISQKQALIHQTEVEIKEVSNRIQQYTYLLENENILTATLSRMGTNIKSR